MSRTISTIGQLCETKKHFCIFQHNDSKKMDWCVVDIDYLDKFIHRDSVRDNFTILQISPILDDPDALYGDFSEESWMQIFNAKYGEQI